MKALFIAGYALVIAAMLVASLVWINRPTTIIRSTAPEPSTDGPGRMEYVRDPVPLCGEKP